MRRSTSVAVAYRPPLSGPMIVCRSVVRAFLSRHAGRWRIGVLLFGLVALGFGGCAQSPQQLAASSHGKEYFPSSIYGSASRRVVADGQPIPRGGGQYLVGKPYTIAGQTYYPGAKHTVQIGNASWYGDAFHGRLTANGEIYDRNSFTAAHPTMPLPSYARVTNLRNNYSMIVRVNDRGPYASNRIMDVSSRVADALDFKRTGTAPVKVEYVGAASLAGSDDAKLYATLQQNGPAHWPGERSTMVAEAAPSRARVASIEPTPSSYRNTQAGREDTLERDAQTLAQIREPRDRAPMRLGRQDQNEHLSRPPVEEMRSTSSGHTTKQVVAMLPPSRPMDLGTIPGAASQIGRHHSPTLHMARARDD